ncbi:hypothetical protein GOP47_0012956 [Adiantum capillus-veneris]|uniref:Uncharacterized protein n=1 Tax=Adiantum capillus-veneris TaxID=13818 RepID=A0A9D4ZE98_ADICA|nr:hypothetical protein GOP47_0012399 [Adiantum capillus-veneris]KAI5072850.1 hypothetical protein GOP47_0012956 [Adiantum capillus-veneris]
MEPAAFSVNRRGEHLVRYRPKRSPHQIASCVEEVTGSRHIDADSNGSSDTVSNLHHFLQHTTPRVPSQSLSKSRLRGLSAQGSMDCEKNFFSLNDLWDSFDEWSAYGAGVPILLNSRETVMQYYVPYLSGIQLYASAESELSVRSRGRLGDDSDGSEMDYRDSNSDGCSSDGEALNPWSASEVLERGHGGETLLFEYFESAAPSHRVPLFDKVRNLCTEFQGTKTLCSNEISKSSWLSVAWYPIYRIPMGPTLKDLTACFLTYHSLSTFQTGESTEASGAHSISGSQMHLHPFGLTGYKFRGPVWSLANAIDRQQTTLLLKSSDDWLRRLHVRHPDFDYFMAHFTSNGH